MRDIAFAGTIELRTWWIRARESRISLLDWRRQCHHGPPLRRIGPKDIDSTPVSPRYYSPGLPYTGMQWKCLPVPTDAQGKPAIHYTTVYKVFAKWADDGSLWQAFVASVQHLAAEKQLDISVLHGDGNNTVAKKGVMASAIPATSTRKARRSSP